MRAWQTPRPGPAPSPLARAARSSVPSNAERVVVRYVKRVMEQGHPPSIRKASGDHEARTALADSGVPRSDGGRGSVQFRSVDAHNGDDGPGPSIQRGLPVALSGGGASRSPRCLPDRRDPAKPHSSLLPGRSHGQQSCIDPRRCRGSVRVAEDAEWEVPLPGRFRDQLRSPALRCGSGVPVRRRRGRGLRDGHWPRPDALGCNDSGLLAGTRDGNGADQPRSEDLRGHVPGCLSSSQR